MTTAIAATISLALTVAYAQTMDVGSAQHNVNFNPNYAFSDGTGANQAKIIFTDTRTLTASATENLDLAGVLLDAFGNVITFDRIKAIIVTADPANTNNVLFGGAASAQAAPWFGDVTDVLVIRPGGMIALVAPDAIGYDVTATTADLIKVTNSAGTTGVNYTIVLIGT
jgi:hypothetical protein